MTPEEIIAAVGDGLPPEVLCEADHRGVMLRVPPGHWLAVLTFARERLDCDFFDWLTAVDEADEGFSVVVHVYSLAVLDQLPFKRLLVGQRDDAGGNLRKLRKLRSAVATCASHDLEAIGIWSGDNRLDQPLHFQASGILFP